MPHFIIDCSENITKLKAPKTIIQNVYDAAEATDFCDQGDKKVRINSFKDYNVGNTQDDFIHVFANIMEGRTASQKSKLSRSVFSKLNNLFPEVSIISMNVRDFDAATYCNKSMV